MKTVKNIASFMFLTGALSQVPTWAHATLESSVPTANAKVTSAPAVTLHFNEKPEVSFSSIKVLDATGTDETVGKATLVKTDTNALTVDLKTLKPGKYTVKWVASGHDGHRRMGDYVFLVK